MPWGCFTASGTEGLDRITGIMKLQYVSVTIFCVKLLWTLN